MRDIQIMLGVAEAGSFRRAAKCLNIGQSAVTRRIQKLEEALGVSLFERRTTGARLTYAGWSFAQRARSLAIDAAHTAGRGRNGRLKIGLIASLSYGAFREVLLAYKSSHPQVELTFRAAAGFFSLHRVQVSQATTRAGAPSLASNLRGRAAN
ncbi:LysR family transcriptional regulator [Pelagibius litoralis]